MTSAIEAAVRRVVASDLPEIRALVEREPVLNVFLAARLEYATQSGTFEPYRLAGDLLAYAPRGRLESLCFVGGNVVPVAASEDAVRAFGWRLARRPRHAASLVGPADAVLPLWESLEASWGPAREVRERQPVLAIADEPAVAPDPQVRRVEPLELDLLFPAAVAMFTEEVGVSPVADGGVGYRARVRELISNGHAFARFEPGPDGTRVVFKADIGCASPAVCQVQGVWVAPDQRGQGMSVAAMATVVRLARASVAPTVSLYVNDFNHVARRVYARVGFSQVGTFATVLL